MNIPNEMVFCGAAVVESFYTLFFHTRNLKVKEFSVFIVWFALAQDRLPHGLEWQHFRPDSGALEMC